jgi:hypothetical protein
MKKTITLLAILYVANIFATDRFVNPNLSQGNGTTIFTTITAAVAAAENGDRIIVASSTYNEAELTIDKSLQIIPQTTGGTIGFNSNIIFNGFIGMKVELLGFNLGNYNFLTNPIPDSSSDSYCNISLINSRANKANFDNFGYYLNSIHLILTNDLLLKNGGIYLSEMNNCYLLDELGTNTDNEKIKFVKNEIKNDLYIFNDNHEIIVANNKLNNLIVQKWVLDINKTNYIINNEFKNNCNLHFACFDSGTTGDGGLSRNVFNINYNFKISNNIFLGVVNFLTASFVNNSPWGRISYGFDYYSYGNFEAIGYTTSNSLWPNPNFGGFFEWSYNFINIPPWSSSFAIHRYNVERGAGKLSYTDILGSQNVIDSGSPNHFYYDLDLSINDRGVNGGPYSHLNYNANNPNNSRAFIFDLEMPVDLFPGQNIEIKAKGYHKN